MSTDQTYIFKRSFLSYIDICIAVLNFLVIVFPLILFSKNISISLIGIGVAAVLIVMTILTFIKNNPFYIHYCYALMLCSLFFFFRLMLINALFGAGILPTAWYIYTFYGANEMYNPSLVPYNNNINLSSHRNPKRVDRNIAYKRKERTEIIKKHYNSDLSRKYSVILSLSLIIIFFLYILT